MRFKCTNHTDIRACFVSLKIESADTVTVNDYTDQMPNLIIN